MSNFRHEQSIRSIDKRWTIGKPVIFSRIQKGENELKSKNKKKKKRSLFSNNEPERVFLSNRIRKISLPPPPLLPPLLPPQKITEKSQPRPQGEWNAIICFLMHYCWICVLCVWMSLYRKGVPSPASVCLPCYSDSWSKQKREFLFFLNKWY